MPPVREKHRRAEAYRGDGRAALTISAEANSLLQLRESADGGPLSVDRGDRVGLPMVTRAR